MNWKLIDKRLSDLKMSRRQLALKAGIKESTMSMWFVRRTEKIPYKYVRSMAKVLGVDEVDLQWSEWEDEEWEYETDDDAKSSQVKVYFPVEKLSPSEELGFKALSLFDELDEKHKQTALEMLESLLKEQQTEA